MMKRNGSKLSLPCGILALLLLSVSLQAVTVRFVTGMWSVDGEGNVAPAYIPFGESHQESLPTCVLEASGLPDDEYIIHDCSDDTFSWTCGPVGGPYSTVNILTGETAAPNTITQPGSYTLTITGYTRYYIQRNVNGTPVLEGPFTATLEPANEHYSLSRPVKVVEVFCIQGHGKMSTRSSVPQLRGEDASGDAGSRRESDSNTRPVSPVNRDGEVSNEPQDGSWTDNETIYAQPGAKINLNMFLNPGIAIDEDSRVKIRWEGFGNVSVNANDPRNVILTPTGFGRGTAAAFFGSNYKIIQIRCVPMAVHEVDFVNDIPILRDTTGIAYCGAAWKDSDMDGDSELEGQNADADKKYQPVAYCSTDCFSAKAKFRPNEKKCDGITLLQESDYDVVAEIIKVRFSIFWGPQTYRPAVSYNPVQTTVTDNRPFHTINTVDYRNWIILWDIGFGESGTTDSNLAWAPSSSTHELYLTYNGHTPAYETVFHIGCTQANGSNISSDIFNNIWNYFADLHVKRKDNTPLTYYGSFLTANYRYQDLLHDTDGQCGAWATLLINVITTQIPNINIIYRTVVPSISDAKGFMVNKWTFSDNGTSGNPDYPYRNVSSINFIQMHSYLWGVPCEVEYTEGTAGQNNSYPASIFENHQMIQYQNVYYDPSYGLTHSSLQSIDNTISGFYQEQNIGNVNFHYFMKNPIGNQIVFKERRDYN